MTNVQKTPISRSLPAFVSQRSLDQIAKQGLAIPGHVVAISGAIVTVSFEVAGLTLPQVTMPLGSPEYIRLPIQVKDKGLAVPASFYLGGISGLGGGTATDTLQGNLSTLFWVPIGSKNFSAVDPNALTLYGPNGVTLRDSASQTAATLTPGSGMAITGGGLTVATGASGTFTTPTGQTVTFQDGLCTNIF